MDYNPEKNRSVSPLTKVSKKPHTANVQSPTDYYLSHSNLSESAIYITDEEDTLSTESTNLISFQGYNFQPKALEIDRESECFQKRPLSDTPVLSETTSPIDHISFSPLALSDNDNNDNNDEDNEVESNNNANVVSVSPKTDKTDSSSSNPSTPTKFLKDNIATSNLIVDHSIFIPHKLLPKPMERIESGEPMVSSHSNTSVFDIPGQNSSRSSPDGTINSTRERLVVIMIGLPARGKSYLSNKLVRYLNWLQINARIFNVGVTRRTKASDAGPEKSPLPDHEMGETSHDANFFSPNNKTSIDLREQWARETLDNLLDYLLKGDGCVGVFDATNTTVARRKMVFDRIKQRSNGQLRVLFLESICNDLKIIEGNVLLKLQGPDYRNMDPTIAKADFLGRLKNYEKVYETISLEEEKNKEFQYIQMVDVGRKIIACNIDGFLASQIVYYFLNFNLSDRLIFITRHGESFDNVKGKIGGDAGLTERGKRYAKALEKFVSMKRTEFDLQHPQYSEAQFSILSSMLRRSIETVEAFPEKNYDIKQNYDVKQLRVLNELGSGIFEGMTYPEIQAQHPAEFEARIKNKLRYRYPGIGGESYLDVISRLKPIINEIERSTGHMMIISHRVVCRILLAYFLNLKRESIGDLDVPLHAVYLFEPKPFGVDWSLWEYDEVADKFKEVDVKTLESTKKVKQVGITFRERKYSVVPTAPKMGSGLNSKGGSMIKRSSQSQSQLGSIRMALQDAVQKRTLKGHVADKLQNPRGYF